MTAARRFYIPASEPEDRQPGSSELRYEETAAYDVPAHS